MLKKQERRPMIPPPERRHEVGSPPTIIIDGMNLAYRAYYAYYKLKHGGKSTSILFGLPTLIKNYITTNCWRPGKVVVVWDGIIHKKRLEVLPTYKAHRQQKRDPQAYKKFLSQVKKTRRFLHYMGITQIHNKGVEGDDMIHIATRFYSAQSPVIIISGDKDFRQLVNRDVTLYDPGKDVILTPRLVCTVSYGVHYNQYVDFLCLTGDSSDDIPGYKGIGEVKAAKFLEMFGSIKEYLKSDEVFPGLLDKDKLRKIWKRNRLLIDLEYFNRKYNKDATIKYYRGDNYPEFDRENYIRMCIKYRLNTLRDKFFSYFIYKTIHHVKVDSNIIL